MTSAPAAAPLWTRGFVLLTAAHFLQALGYSSMLLLPLYVQHLGGSRAEIGAIMAASAIGGLALRPVVGWSLDRLGRKPTIIACTLLTALGMGGLMLVRDTGWPIYALRVLFGIGAGGMFTGYFTLAADLVPPHRRTEGIALFGISGLLPLALNPVAGEVGVAAADLRWYLPAVGLVVLASLLALAPIQEGRRPPPLERSGVRAAAAALLQRPLWPVWLATIVFSGLLGLFFAFATVAAERRGIERPAVIWFSYAAGAVAVRLLGARLPDRLGPANLVAPALATYTAACLLVAAADSRGDFLAAGLLAGLGHGYCFPVLTSQVVSRVEVARRGAGLAAFTAIWEATGLALPPLMGWFADGWGDRAMFALAAVLATVTLGLWAGLEHRLAPAR